MVFSCARTGDIRKRLSKSKHVHKDFNLKARVLGIDNNMKDVYLIAHLTINLTLIKECKTTLIAVIIARLLAIGSSSNSHNSIASDSR
jgi:hypothetical protein